MVFPVPVASVDRLSMRSNSMRLPTPLLYILLQAFLGIVALQLVAPGCFLLRLSVFYRISFRSMYLSELGELVESLLACRV